MLCLKKFLDETAENISNLPQEDIEILFSQLIEVILEENTQDPDEEIEEILKFCSASVLEMTKASRKSLIELFKNSNRLKKYPNFHVLANAITSKMIKESISAFEIEFEWIDSILAALISGLTTIESETISLSGSSIIKLLKWERTYRKNLISKRLADHDDFVAILTADMCAMFSRMEEENNLAPFIRIIRYCELVIDVSDSDSGLRERIVETVQNEFISKVYRTTLKEAKDKFDWPLNWCNELLKTCHRGNELVKPLLNEVFSKFSVEEHELLSCNSDLIEIVSNERSRPIESIVNLLFTFETAENPELFVTLNHEASEGSNVVVDDLIYRSALRKQLESFEQYKITNSKEICGITAFALELFTKNRSVLINWLPYCLKVPRTNISTEESEMKMYLDISKKLVEYLEL